MKLKIAKSAIISSFLIFLMLGSSITYFFLQAFRPTGLVALPEENIIDYELTPEQENLAIQKGKTLVKFFYGNECSECIDKKSYLEDFAKRFKNQIILQEIVENRSSYKILISSFFGQRVLRNCTNDEIFKAFCDLMFSPPAECIKFA